MAIAGFNERKDNGQRNAAMSQVRRKKGTDDEDFA